MNYARIYNRIVERGLTRPSPGYVEEHHIIPVSLGGSNTRSNLVNLTAREHFICHWLLVKMYKNNISSYYKMLKAFNMMLVAHTTKQCRYSKMNSRLFELYRLDFAKSMSFTQQGENNSQFGTKWICNIEQQINKKISAKDSVPDGWVCGRNKWVVKTKPIKRIRERIYKNGYKVMVDGKVFDSISQAADHLGIGHETARMRFKSNSFPTYLIINKE